MNDEAATKYIKNRLERMVENGKEADQEFATRSIEGGVSDALAWFYVHLKTSEQGQVAQVALMLLERGKTMREVGQSMAEEVASGIRYMVLENNQMHVAGHMASMQAKNLIVGEINGFDWSE